MTLDWTEFGGGAFIHFSWAYPGQSKQMIPSQYYYHDPTYVASAPYYVTVTCPTGYGGDTLSNPGE